MFTTSTPDFAMGYDMVRAEHRSGALEFIEERSLKGGIQVDRGGDHAATTPS